jgi:hypothetical protein
LAPTSSLQCAFDAGGDELRIIFPVPRLLNYIVGAYLIIVGIVCSSPVFSRGRNRQSLRLAASRSRPVAALEPELDPLLIRDLGALFLALGLSSQARLLAFPLSACLVSGDPLGQLEVEALELEESALFAADLVRDGSSLAPILVGEDMSRVTVLQTVHRTRTNP